MTEKALVFYNDNLLLFVLPLLSSSDRVHLALATNGYEINWNSNMYSSRLASHMFSAYQ